MILNYVLQRGRAHVSAEGGVAQVTDPARIAASTGPRSRERGRVQPAGAVVEYQRFNGAALT